MLKGFLACSAAATVAFVFMGLQTGLFGVGPNRAVDEEDGEVQAIAKIESAPARAMFPDDLAPAARANPVAAAAQYTPGDRVHKLAFLKVNGAMHSWQEEAVGYSEEWAADTVEETELVVVVGKQSKRMIERVSFKNGPPIDRIEWEVEASVVEAKTGRVLANRTFINRPRTVRGMEAYATTALGAPVHYLTVFNWVSAQSRRGFTPQTYPPLVTTVERQ